MDYTSKADLLYQEVEAYQNAIEAVMAAPNASPSDVATMIEFQKDNLKDEVIKCYKTRSNYAYAADVIKGEIDVLNARVKELKARAEKFEQKAAIIDEVIKGAMRAMDEDRIFTPVVTIETKSSLVVEIDDEEAVPDELRNPPKPGTPSKKLLKSYLTDNPDCDFAHMEQSYDIKYTVE